MGTVDRAAAARAIDAFLRAIGRDPGAEPSLRGTGERVAAAYLDELCDGYGVDVPALLRADAIAHPPGGTEIVILHDVALSTVCPHHLLPSSGLASIAFAPGPSLVGLGTITRVAAAFAHRLALQEDIGENIAGALVLHLSAKWAACRIAMTHQCVVARGTRQHAARAETWSFAGDPAARGLALGVVGARP